jgi:hypothetical protein
LRRGTASSARAAQFDKRPSCGGYTVSVRRSDIGKVGKIRAGSQLAKSSATPRSERDRLSGKKLGISRWHIVRGNCAEDLAVESEQDAVRGLAQAHRPVEHRVENRREIAGRAVDDPQHLGGRGLLLQGLAGLGDQPRVFDRDDRLRRCGRSSD